MLLGVYVMHRFATKYFSRRREAMLTASSTVLGTISRMAFMTVVNWIFLPYPYPIGFSIPVEAVTAMLPIIGFFNATLVIYTIPIGYLLARAVGSGTKMTIWSQKFLED